MHAEWGWTSHSNCHWTGPYSYSSYHLIRRLLIGGRFGMWTRLYSNQQIRLAPRQDSPGFFKDNLQPLNLAKSSDFSSVVNPITIVWSITKLQGSNEDVGSSDFTQVGIYVQVENPWHDVEHGWSWQVSVQTCGLDRLGLAFSDWWL